MTAVLGGQMIGEVRLHQLLVVGQRGEPAHQAADMVGELGRVTSDDGREIAPPFLLVHQLVREPLQPVDAGAARHAQRQVQRGFVAGHRVVPVAPWNVEHVPRMEFGLDVREPLGFACVDGDVVVFVERVFVRLLGDDPSLRPLDLQDEDLMVVVVLVEPLLLRPGAVHVDLTPVADRTLDRRRQFSDRGQPPLQLIDDEGVAVLTVPDPLFRCLGLIGDLSVYRRQADFFAEPETMEIEKMVELIPREERTESVPVLPA